MSDVTAIEPALYDCRRRLLDERVDGHWRGELSSSALSTATAVFALKLVASATSPCLSSRENGQHGLVAHATLIARGTQWLIDHQNPDGGWGDTVRSHSNISTTALCWAALAGSDAAETLSRADAWLARAAGSLRPADLAAAITKRYGKDRTFSVPILTMCALAGRLGEGREAWRHIPALPFELAACPHRWFAALRLPVVSYALPALIAMGQVRHHHRPTRNLVARALRRATRRRTLLVLREIQPTSGGYLEATPLTSFVVMSLVGAGQVDHPVVRAGVEFLVRSARPEGSWAIDTDLATWLTTLSVNALAIGGRLEEQLPADERRRIVDWLLGQQYRVEHPYTHAAPGGWAWTDLPGGVPDADDTAGALIALHHLAKDEPRVREAAALGVEWLLNLQNRDGGMPTFCRGWGALPFDCSGADLTAHAIHAWAVSESALPDRLRSRVDAAMSAAVRYLGRVQRPDGSWIPLWFGNQDHAAEENPVYGTSRVLAGLSEIDSGAGWELEAMIDRGVEFLLKSQRGDGGWGDGGGSIEETSLAVTALALSWSAAPEAQERGRAWLSRRLAQNVEAAPIGFYFAKLWYFERLYPFIFAAGASASEAVSRRFAAARNPRACPRP